MIRYEDWCREDRSVSEKIAEHKGLRVKRRTHPVALDDAPSILPRKGIIGDWRNDFEAEDEQFVREAIERAGLSWDAVIDRQD